MGKLLWHHCETLFFFESRMWGTEFILKVDPLCGRVSRRWKLAKVDSVRLRYWWSLSFSLTAFQGTSDDLKKGSRQTAHGRSAQLQAFHEFDGSVRREKEEGTWCALFPKLTMQVGVVPTLLQPSLIFSWADKFTFDCLQTFPSTFNPGDVFCNKRVVFA